MHHRQAHFLPRSQEMAPRAVLTRLAGAHLGFELRPVLDVHGLADLGRVQEPPLPQIDRLLLQGLPEAPHLHGLPMHQDHMRRVEQLHELRRLVKVCMRREGDVLHTHAQRHLHSGDHSLCRVA